MSTGIASPPTRESLSWFQERRTRWRQAPRPKVVSLSSPKAADRAKSIGDGGSKSQTQQGSSSFGAKTTAASKTSATVFGSIPQTTNSATSTSATQIRATKSAAARPATFGTSKTSNDSKTTETKANPFANISLIPSSSLPVTSAGNAGNAPNSLSASNASPFASFGSKTSEKAPQSTLFGGAPKLSFGFPSSTSTTTENTTSTSNPFLGSSTTTSTTTPKTNETADTTKPSQMSIFGTPIKAFSANPSGTTGKEADKAPLFGASSATKPFSAFAAPKASPSNLTTTPKGSATATSTTTTKTMETSDAAKPPQMSIFGTPIKAFSANSSGTSGKEANKVPLFGTSSGSKPFSTFAAPKPSASDSTTASKGNPFANVKLTTDSAKTPVGTATSVTKLASSEAPKAKANPFANVKLVTEGASPSGGKTSSSSSVISSKAPSLGISDPKQASSLGARAAPATRPLLGSTKNIHTASTTASNPFANVQLVVSSDTKAEAASTKPNFSFGAAPAPATKATTNPFSNVQLVVPETKETRAKPKQAFGATPKSVSAASQNSGDSTKATSNPFANVKLVVPETKGTDVKPKTGSLFGATPAPAPVIPSASSETSGTTTTSASIPFAQATLVPEGKDPKPSAPYSFGNTFQKADATPLATSNPFAKMSLAASTSPDGKPMQSIFGQTIKPAQKFGFPSAEQQKSNPFGGTSLFAAKGTEPKQAPSGPTDAKTNPFGAAKTNPFGGTSLFAPKPPEVKERSLGTAAADEPVEKPAQPSLFGGRSPFSSTSSQTGSLWGKIASTPSPFGGKALQPTVPVSTPFSASPFTTGASTSQTSPSKTTPKNEGGSSGTDYRNRLVEFYKKHNPEKVDTVDATLAKYQGKEQELFKKLEAKYGVSGFPPPSGSGPTCFLEFSIDGQPAGRVVMKLYQDKTPLTAENFRCLCTGEKGTGRSTKPLCYRHCKVHRVVPGFCVQLGDFTKGDGTGGESIYPPNSEHGNFWGKFKDEPFMRHSKKGLLSMANSGPNSNSSQFFFTLKPVPMLDGKHVVFGEVLEGMDVVEKIEALETNKKGAPKVPVVVSDCGEIKE